MKALANETFDWQGEFYQIPRTSIRPRPISSSGTAVLCVVGQSGELAELMAKLGFGMLIVMQNEWPKAAEDVHRFRDITRSVGHTPRPPIVLTNVSCAPTREEARERAFRFLGEKWDSIDNHYHFSDGHLANVKGYESYAKVGEDLCQDEGSRPTGPRRRISMSASRWSARRTTASSRSANCAG